MNRRLIESHSGTGDSTISSEHSHEHYSRTGTVIPEVLDGCLDEGFTITARFSPTGALLASGCNDGKVLLFDLTTKLQGRVMLGHVGPVTSVCWLSDVLLVSGGVDGKVCVWDLIRRGYNSEPTFLFPHDTPVLSLSSSSVDGKRIIVNSLGRTPVLYDISTCPPRIWKLPITMMGTMEEICLVEPQDEVEDLIYNYTGTFNTTSPSVLYVTTGEGDIMKVDANRRKIVETMNLSRNQTTVRSIKCSQDGTMLLVNGSDKAIYSLDAQTLAITDVLKQPIENRAWKCVCLSPCNRYVISADVGMSSHRLLVWERSSGLIVKEIDGPSESVIDLAWHPHLPAVVVSVSAAGLVYLWDEIQRESWSAYTTRFQELKFNTVYEEREDEFDLQRPPETKKLVPSVNLADEYKNTAFEPVAVGKTPARPQANTVEIPDISAVIPAGKLSESSPGIDGSVADTGGKSKRSRKRTGRRSKKLTKAVKHPDDLLNQHNESNVPQDCEIAKVETTHTNLFAETHDTVDIPVTVAVFGSNETGLCTHIHDSEDDDGIVVDIDNIEESSDVVISGDVRDYVAKETTPIGSIPEHHRSLNVRSMYGVLDHYPYPEPAHNWETNSPYKKVKKHKSTSSTTENEMNKTSLYMEGLVKRGADGGNGWLLDSDAYTTWRMAEAFHKPSYSLISLPLHMAHLWKLSEMCVGRQ
eukprot:CFRG5754T1